MINPHLTHRVAPTVVLAVAWIHCLAPPAWSAAANDALFTALAEHVGALPGLDAAARQIAVDALAQRGPDADDESVLVEVLALINEPFRTGLDAYDEDNFPVCFEAMDALRHSTDPFVEHNARFYAVKALVELDRLVEAQAMIEVLLAENADFERHALGSIELAYMLGYCQVQNLDHDKAQATLEAFLEDYPDAPDRFVVTARQMLAELNRRVPESIGEVADLMTFSGQRLAAGDSAERVQTAQQRVLALLDKLIDKTEQMEQQSSSSSNNQQQQQQQQQNQRQSSKPKGGKQPLEQSGTPPSKSAAGDRRAGREVNPGDSWGAMPDAQREQVLQVLRDRFPGRYRALVEQYYRGLAEEP